MMRMKILVFIDKLTKCKNLFINLQFLILINQLDLGPVSHCQNGVYNKSLVNYVTRIDIGYFI